MKIGIVFSGQGAQYCGMGKDLYEVYPKAKNVFDSAGEQIKQWCFEADEETLKQTHITQPTIYTMTMAAYEALKSEMQKQEIANEFEIVGLAGFSLGEYSALTAAGTIDNITKGIEIVTKRGIFMQEAGLDEEGCAKGSMVAAIGGREDILQAVEIAREDGILEGVNFNAPMQTVVAGDKAAVKRFRKTAKGMKVKAIPLSVSTAFHSPMMIKAAERLEEVLMEADLKEPKKTIYANITAEDIMKDYDGENVSQYLTNVLVRQAKSPVYWEETIKNLEKAGVEVIIEVGPGKTLTGLTKNICPEMVTLNVENVETLGNTIIQLKAMCE